MTSLHLPEPSRGIHLHDVTLTRGGRRVFEGLSLALTEPRIGLIGDNGAGKTSLLRLIAGLEAPAAGRVTVHGLDTVRDRAGLPRQVGLLFQNPDDQIIFPTVEEELAFTLHAQGMARRAAREAARGFLATRGLADWAGRAVGELSQGQRQRVCLLALDIGRPATLLLDEPFASLDLPGQALLARQVLASAPQILFSTHVLAQVEPFERVLWLDEGRVRADGPGAAVCAAYRADVARRAAC